MNKRQTLHLAEGLRRIRPGTEGRELELWYKMTNMVGSRAIPRAYVADFFDRAGYVPRNKAESELSGYATGNTER